MSAAADHAQATLDGYSIKLGNFIRYLNTIGVTMPSQIGEEHLIAYILHKKKTCNGVTINTCYRHVRAWINWMVQRGILKTSPCAGLKTPTLPKTIIKPLSPDQVESMAACCTNHFSGIRDKAIIILLYDSGLRRNELSNITLDDIDIKHSAIRVMGKGARERRVPLGDTARAALMQYLCLRHDAEPWLFITHYKDRPGKLTPNGISLVVKRAMQRAKITGVKPKLPTS